MILRKKEKIDKKGKVLCYGYVLERVGREYVIVGISEDEFYFCFICINYNRNCRKM